MMRRTLHFPTIALEPTDFIRLTTMLTANLTLNTPKKKIEGKVLVWLAISAAGVSDLIVRKSGSSSVTAEVYQKKILTPALTKFITRYHGDRPVLFWPDLAPAHYAKSTMNWYQEKDIHVLPKHINPPCLPAARPIEDAWTLLSQEVYRGGWSAKNERCLIQRLKKAVKKVDFRPLMAKITCLRSTLKKVALGGPDAIEH